MLSPTRSVRPLVHFMTVVAIGTIASHLCTPSIAQSAKCSVKNVSTAKVYTSIQSAINAVTSIGVSTLNVTGACSENVSVPFAKNIMLSGQGSGQAASLSPKIARSAAAYALGTLTIQNMTIQSGSLAVSALLQAESGGTLSIISSKVESSAAQRLVTGDNGSHLTIINSSIKLTGSSDAAAIELSSGSSLVIEGSSAEAIGPNSYTTVISAGASSVGINCSIGGSVTVGAQGSGAVQIKDSNKSIDANGCSIGLFNNATSGAGIALTGNAKDGMALWNSNARIRNATISGNGRMGINLWTSNVYMYGTSFQSNGNSDIWSGVRSNAALDGPSPNKQNSFLSLSSGSFSCYVDGKIYYQTESVVQDLSSYAADNPSCLSSYE